MAARYRIATCSLAGCFGCHMSLLDLDERLLELLDIVAFDRSPFTDTKRFTGPVDLGLIEGGVGNAENAEILRDFRRHCRILVSVGACAINGGVPALRNGFAVSDCLAEAYLNGPGLEQPRIPRDPELPLLLDRVYPVHEVVAVDHYLPGCPPSAEAFGHFLTELLAGRDPSLPPALIHYD